MAKGVAAATPLAINRGRDLPFSLAAPTTVKAISDIGVLLTQERVGILSERRGGSRISIWELAGPPPEVVSGEGCEHVRNATLTPSSWNLRDVMFDPWHIR